MKRDDLHDLLRQGDQGAPPPPLVEALAARVRRKRRRRQNARTAAMGVVSMALLAAWLCYPLEKPMDGHPPVSLAPAVIAPPESVAVAELTAADILLLRRDDQALAQARRLDPLARLRLDLNTMNRMTRDFQGEIK